MPKLKTPKLKTYKYYKNKLDEVFSGYIRTRDTQHNGFAKCITCPEVLPYKKLQAGHYISRSYLATRWEPLNVAAQCGGCNLYKKGAPDEFALVLLNLYGADILENLNIAKHRQVKFSRHDLIGMIELYKLKTRDLLEEEINLDLI